MGNHTYRPPPTNEGLWIAVIAAIALAIIGLVF
jgi:preprotein translocase subunit Sss1